MKFTWSQLKERWPDGLNLVLGVWLLASPWALGFVQEMAAAYNSFAVGAIIAVAALAALLAFHEWEEWVSLALGAWLAVSPWVLGYTALAFATWNHVIVGLVALALAAWGIWQSRHAGAGQTSAA